MRRKDREMPREFGLDLIDRSDYGVMSLISQEGEAYGVALSMVRSGSYIYFHSGLDGRKVRSILENPRVGLTFVGEVKVPKNYTKDDLDSLMKTDNPASFVSKIFTTEFESAYVSGPVEEVLNEEEKIKAMRLICEKYTKDMMDYFDTAISSSLKRTRVFRVEIESLTAKRKKYNEKGQELKWEGP